MTTNYASAVEGGKLVDFSSELEGCNATHVLDPQLSNIWLSEEGLPQWLCISLDGIKDKRDLVIRTIGWHCWHPYTTNPREVTIHVSSDGAKFKIWDTFHAQLIKGTQLFCCAPISASIYPFIALEVTQTFGGPQTYMNRVYMYAEELNTTTSETHLGGGLHSVASPLAAGAPIMNESYYHRSSPARSRSRTQSQSQSQSQSPTSRYTHHQGGGKSLTTYQDPRRSHDSDDNRDNHAIAHNLDTALGIGMHDPDREASFFSSGEGEGENTSLESRLETVERVLGVRCSREQPTARAGTVSLGKRDAGERAQVVGESVSEERLSHLEGRVSQLLSTLETFSLTASDGAPSSAIPEAYDHQPDEEHESRFSRAMESIEALVTNVLERVERRHATAVQAAAEAGTDVETLQAEMKNRVECPKPKAPEVLALDIAELRAEYFGRQDALLSSAPPPLHSLSERSRSAAVGNEEVANPEVSEIVSRLHEAVRQRAYKALQLEMLLQGGVHHATVEQRAPKAPLNGGLCPSGSRCSHRGQQETDGRLDSPVRRPSCFHPGRGATKQSLRALSPRYSRETQSAALKKKR